jgi:hypothetical protein
MMLVGGCASTPASRPTGDCAGTEATAIEVVRVEPYVHVVQRQRGDVDREIRGASLWVRAQPGLTAEWLHHTLACHPAGIAGRDQVTIAVESENDAFRVDLVDAEHGEAILAHARRSFASAR